MKRMVCLLMALILMIGVCASAEAYVMGPFSFEAPVQLQQGALALMLEGEGMDVKLSSLPAMSLPRSYAEVMEPADLMELVHELDKSTFEDVDTFELDGGVYGSVYTDGEERVAHFVCGMDMLYVTVPAGDGADELLSVVKDSVAYDAGAEPVKVQLPMGSFLLDVPAGWYLCSYNGGKAEFAPETGSVGVQLVSADKLGVDMAAMEDADAEAVAKKLGDMVAEAFGGEHIVTDNGMHAVKYWREVSETSSVLTAFVINGADILVVISSAKAGDSTMEDLTAACLSGISAAK